MIVRRNGDICGLFAAVTAIACALLPLAGAFGTPETWFEPAATLLGTPSGSRFGSSLACSNPVGGPAGESFVAVGAPDEDNGAGAVYVYRLSTSRSAPVQRIVSGDAAAGQGFGASIAYINDINGDGKDELVIGAPNLSGASGKVWIYWSNATGDPFSYCNVHTGGAGWGRTITAMRSFRSSDPVGTVVVGSAGANQVKSLTVSFTGSLGPNVCNVALQGFFDATGPAQSAFGSSLAEVPFNGTLVGAPAYSSFAGRVYLVGQYGQQTLIQTGSAGDLLGMAVAGRGSSVYSAYAAASTGLVAVKKVTQNLNPLVDHCSIPLSIPQSQGQGIAHLGDTFSSFLGGSGDPDATFATYRTESETGGSVALFVATNSGVCRDVRVVNNCQYDPEQEQGIAVTGGSSCTTSLVGTAKSMLVIGAPGFNGAKGRVDVIVEGSEMSEAKPCQAGGLVDPPTPTPTPEPTATPTPDPQGGESPSSADRPLLIQPGYGGLPAPRLTKLIGSGLIEIALPEVKVRKSEALARFIAKRWRIDLRRSRSIVRGGYTVFYQITLTTRAAARQRAALQLLDVLIEPAFAEADVKRRIINTRNRKTLVRASPGALLTSSFRVGVRFSGDRRVIFTKPSPNAQFQN